EAFAPPFVAVQQSFRQIGTHLECAARARNALPHGHAPVGFGDRRACEARIAARNLCSLDRAIERRSRSAPAKAAQLRSRLLSACCRNEVNTAIACPRKPESDVPPTLRSSCPSGIPWDRLRPRRNPECESRVR